MLSSFSDLFCALNNWCKANSHCDLTMVEAAMTELVNAWTDALMSGIEEPTDRDIAEHCRAVHIVSRF